jgi:beta-lactamase superfamily II metal-dependent hydrolase
MHGFFMIFFSGRRRSVTHPDKQNIGDATKQMTEFELKDIVIYRVASGKLITAARMELERRGISLTDSERQLQEAKKQERIEYAKRNS